MTGHRIPLGKSFKLGKDGKLRKSDAHLDVSAKLRRRASKRVRVIRRPAPR
jgi:hypothetical protein